MLVCEFVAAVRVIALDALMQFWSVAPEVTFPAIPPICNDPPPIRLHVEPLMHRCTVPVAIDMLPMIPPTTEPVSVPVHEKKLSDITGVPAVTDPMIPPIVLAVLLPVVMTPVTMFLEIVVVF
jgi:hypothetical protein